MIDLEKLRKIGLGVIASTSPEVIRQVQRQAWLDAHLCKLRMVMSLSDDECHWLGLLIMDIASTKAQESPLSISQVLDRVVSNIDQAVMSGKGWDELRKMIVDYKGLVADPSRSARMPKLPAWINETT